jgi:site-specific DNA-methyltransferase (adenine-specific)
MNLMLGDCLERMKEIPDGSVDLILADPPYGTTACKWDSVIPLDKMWEQLKRIIKPNGAIVLFGIEPFSSFLRCSNIKMFKYDWIWVKTKKTGFTNAKNRPLSNYEIVSVFSEGTVANCSPKRMLYNPQGLEPLNRVIKGGKNKSKGDDVGHSYYRPSQDADYIREWTNYPSNVIYFANEGKTVHPTQKPVDLMEYLIKTYTQEGETVLDFVMGSGTTGIACKNTGRKFIGIEKDAGYFEIAKQRLCV